MSLNCSELEKICSTFPVNTVIKNIFQIDRNSLVLETYDRDSYYKILIDTTDRFNHICMLPQKFILKKTNMRFGQYLNSQFTGARITGIGQHEMSRIIVFDIIKGTDNFKLICRLWGTASNVLLTDNNNCIIDCLKRLPKINEWPSEDFVFPERKKVDKIYKVREEFDNEDINSSVYEYFRDIKESEDMFKLKNKLVSFLQKEIDTLEKQILMAVKNTEKDHALDYLKKGELLKANIYLMEKGEKSITLEDYETGKKMEITLSVDLSPSGNIEKYFSKYKKVKDGIARWKVHTGRLQDKKNTYEEILDFVEDNDEYKKLVEISDRINTGKVNKLKGYEDRQKIPGRKFILSHNYCAYVSRSSKDADKILSLVASGNDYWFHIRDYAGSHVVVKEIKNAEIPDAVKIEASMLALYYSKGRYSDEGDIYFTRIKYLHKGKNSPSGMVFPTQEKNIKVKFDRNVLESIFARLQEK